MRLHTLQYLRAIAALVVVYSHAVLQVESYQPYLKHFGGFGVDIFFVISGFIMLYIAKPGDTPTRFISNRISRVVPLYWFFVLLMAAILLLAPALFKTTQFDVPVILKSLFFIPHYSLAYPDMVWPIVAPGWSLNYEMYFYLIFAVSLLAPLGTRVWVITLVIAAAFIAAWAYPSHSAFSVFFRDTIVFEFILGLLLARLHLQGFKVSVPVAWCLLILGFALMLAHIPMLRIFSVGIPALLVVIGTLNCRLPKISFFVLLGDSSYALYLCHIFTLGVCRKILPNYLGDGPTAAYWFIALSLVACVISGIIIHFVIDNWLLRKERLNFLGGMLTGSTRTQE